MKTLFVAWQDAVNRSWTPIGRLQQEDKGYTFTYTKATKFLEGFSPLAGMSDINTKYYSEKLFPLFTNRTLPKSRPEYTDYMRWLGLNSATANVMLELSRSFGARATDAIELFPLPSPTSENKYEIYFFSRGYRYFSPASGTPIDNPGKNSRLYLMADIQNEKDETALMLRTESPLSVIGYIPAYFTADISQLIKLVGANAIEVTIEQVNLGAPTQFKYLCKLSSVWPSGFRPFSSEKFESMI